MQFSMMIADNLDLVGVSFSPYKADAPLIVDGEAVLSLAVATQRLKANPGRRSQVAQFDRGIQPAQFPQRNSFHGPKAPDGLALVNELDVLRAKGLARLLSA